MRRRSTLPIALVLVSGTSLAFATLPATANHDAVAANPLCTDANPVPGSPVGQTVCETQVSVEVAGSTGSPGATDCIEPQPGSDPCDGVQVWTRAAAHGNGHLEACTGGDTGGTTCWVETAGGTIDELP